MMKKLVAMLLMLMLCVGLAVTASAATITPTPPVNGDGSEDNPYQITNAAELYWFAEYVNKGNASACAKLMNDITVNENVIVQGALNSDVSGFVEWTPIGQRIGSSTKPFSGTFEGNSCTISGLYVSATNGYKGLIGYMQSGTVKNVTVADSYFSGTTNIGAVKTIWAALSAIIGPATFPTAITPVRSAVTSMLAVLSATPAAQLTIATIQVPSAALVEQLAVWLDWAVQLSIPAI